MSWRYTDITFRPIGRGEWPEAAHDRRRRRAQFSAGWGPTVALLEKELRALGARQVVLQIAIEEKDLRLDGKPRAQARASHPGVILSFESKWGPLRYATDEFDRFQDNVRAIALSMEALRAVDRYGVSKRGEQYRGWRQLPTGQTGGEIEMTREQAERLLAEHGGFRAAAARWHPDAENGDPDKFRLIVKAREIVEGRAR